METHSAEHLCKHSVGELPHNEVLVSVPLLLLFLLHQEKEEQNSGQSDQPCLKLIRCTLDVHLCKKSA